MSESPAAPSAPAAAPSSAPASKPAATAAPTGASPSAAPVGGATPAKAAAPALPHQDGGGGEATNNHPDAQPGETKAETIQRIKLKLKVDGQESEREYTTEELQLLAQKGLGADARFSEAANVKKSFQSFLKAVNEDPFGAFNDPAFGDLGKTYKQKVIEALAKEFQAEEPQKADPAAFELQKLKEENERFKSEATKRQEEARAEAQRKADEVAWAEMKKTWLTALEASGFGQNEALIKRMAMLGQDYLEKQMDLDPRSLVADLKNQLASENKLLMGGMKGEQLAAFLGPDVLKEVAAYQLSLAQKGKVVQEPIKASETENTSKKTVEKEPFDKPMNLLRSFKDFRDGK